MKYTYLIGMVFLVLCISSGCTQNVRTKTLGGKMTVDLPPKTKLINATWKNGDVWYLTRPMRSDEKAEEITFQEKSSFGLAEGTIIFREKE